MAPKSTNLGLKLGISISQINIIKANYSLCTDQLRAILEERLNEEEPLKWCDIVTALRADSIREYGLARKIESQYIPSFQLVSSAPQQESTAVTHSTTCVPSSSPQLPTSLALVDECLPDSGNSVASQQQFYCTFQPPLCPNTTITQPPHLIPPPFPSYYPLPYPPSCYPPFYHYPFVPNLTSVPHTQMQGVMRPAMITQQPYLPPQAALSASDNGSVFETCLPVAKRHKKNISSSQIHLPTEITPTNHSGHHQTTTDTMSRFHQFIEYVNTVYKGSAVQRDTCVVKWPPTPSKVYINLVCIDRKVRGLRGKYDDVTEAMVRDGNVDVILREKWPIIDMNEIIPEGKSLVLIEGAPGVGKSTFAWEFCRRWMKGKVAQQHQLVLLLRLRDERISKATTLKDLIYHPSEDVCQAVVAHLQYTLGANILIILEGFDELSEAGRSESSVFLQLICSQLLPLATVMVTSRPWATRVLHLKFSHLIVKHVEILGFNKEQISSYIQSCVSSEDDVRGLEAYLKKHPQIRMCMYIPLNSAIVVTVYQESQDSRCKLPTTLTELYTSLAKILLLRHLCGHSEYEIGSRCLKLFNNLPVPDQVYNNFIELCKLAYTGVAKSGDQVQLIFRDSHVPSNFDNLGFMDSVTELYVSEGTVSSHNFLHLTFQEFFAAIHISTLSPTEQLKHFIKHHLYSGRLTVVLRFLAGLNNFRCFPRENVIKIFEPDVISPHDLTLDSDQIQWMFEAQNDDLITQILGQNKTVCFSSISTMFPMDYYSLGYCIGHSQCQWVLSWRGKIDVEEIKMLLAGKTGNRGRVVELGRNDSTLKISAEALNLFFTELKSILNLHQLHLELPVPCDQITWPDLSALQELTLEVNQITNWRLDSLLSNLSLRLLTINFGVFHLGDLDSTDISFEDYVAIGKSAINLKELVIGETNSVLQIEDVGMETITRALASNHSLEKLWFVCSCTFTNTAVDYLAQFITKCSTLKSLVISNCTFKAHGLLVVAKTLRHRPNLQNHIFQDIMLAIDGDNEVKDLAQIITDYSDMLTFYSLTITGISEIGALTQAINHYNPLRILKICNSSIKDTGSKSLARVLAHNQCLTSIQLSHDRISDDGAVALSQALYQNSTIESLDLSYNNISDVGAVALSQALYQNSTIKSLDLSYNNISDDGAVALSQALYQNSTIESLDLSYNNISDVGAVALANALHHNFTLEELNLFGNHDIGKEGTHQLVQAWTIVVNRRSIYGFKEDYGLVLPSSCMIYAKQCPQFPTVKEWIKFCSEDQSILMSPNNLSKID